MQLKHKNVLLDLMRVLALALIGAGVYLWLGAAPTLIFAGVALFGVVTVVVMRQRVKP